MANQNDTSMDMDIINELEHEENTLAIARERAKALLAKVEELEKNLKLARGTGDLSAEADQAISLTRPTLAQKIEALLRASPMTFDGLVKKLGESAGKVQAAMKPMKQKTSNIGSVDRPVWVWKVGLEGTTAEVRAAILALIKYQPMTFSEIRTATGCRDGQIQGGLVEIRRDPKVHVHNLGTMTRARYFVLPEGAIDATLDKKPGRKTE